MTIWEDILYPVALLSGWSLIYRDNPFWRFFENALVGLGTSITLKMSLDVIINQQLIPISQGKYYPGLVGIIFGILVITRLIPNIKEYSYIPFGLMTGVGAALGAIGAVGPQILSQTALPSFSTGDPWTNFSNFLLFFCTLSTMCYFIFSIKRGALTGPIYGIVSILGRIGRYVMMLAFGVTLSTFYISTGTDLIVYADYLFSPIGRWITLAGVLILIGGVTYSVRKERGIATPATR